MQNNLDSTVADTGNPTGDTANGTAEPDSTADDQTDAQSEPCLLYTSIGAGFGSGVRAVRAQRGRFHKVAFGAQGTVYFIGGNLQRCV